VPARTSSGSSPCWAAASIPKDAEAPHVSVVSRLEELRQPPGHCFILPLGRHPGIVPQQLWHQEEEIVGMSAYMAFPEVKEVHVICGCLSALYLEQNARLLERAKVIRPKAGKRPREETTRLISKTKGLGCGPERCLSSVTWTVTPDN
jgi:hypothetical protein